MRAKRTVLIGGLVAGALDLLGAFISSWLRAGTSPVRVMQSIAAGVLGAAARTGGARSAALGVLLHFVIATIWTAVYYAASRRLRLLSRQPTVCGGVYGVVVYLFMNFVVIPLSAVPRGNAAPPLSARLVGAGIIVVCVGLPIALIVSATSRRRDTTHPAE